MSNLKTKSLAFIAIPLFSGITVSAIALFQSPESPVPYEDYGVLGILGLAISALLAFIWRLFTKQSEMFDSRDKLLMEFVDRHRAESSRAFEALGASISKSQQESTQYLGGIIERHSRKLDEILLIGAVSERLTAMKRKGLDLDDTKIETVVRAIIRERQP